MKENCPGPYKALPLQYAMESLEKSPDGVFWSDADGRIVYANHAACKELGYTREELLGKSISEIDSTILADDLGPDGNFARAASHGEITHLQTLHKHRDGHLIPVDISMGMLEAEHNSLGFSFVRNISEHIDAENKLREAYSNLEKKNNELNRLYQDLSERKRQLEHLAFHDPITGLPNRSLFTENLGSLIRSGQSGTAKLAILLIDIDNFKNINDGFGHSVGDIVLKKVSEKISASLGAADSIYRFGGDEFIILLQNIRSVEDAREYSEKIKNGLLDPLKINHLELYLTVSIGVSLFPDHAVTPECLLMYADTAMYKAKTNGRNHTRFFNSEMKNEVIERIIIQNKLQQAIANCELFLHYQPQFNKRTGLIRGVEALVRWNNLYLGNVSPNVFIPAAEEDGSIFAIGEWVMKQACSDARRWERDYHFDGFLSVNISARQLKYAGFFQTVKETLESTGLSPSHLELEITESVIIDSYESVVPTLMKLKDMGIRICLDDFGTGYSSLSYLMHLPINTLKIDKSFIEKIDSSPVNRNLFASVISLVSGLGIETIVEGVETAEQLGYIQETKAGSFAGLSAEQAGAGGKYPMHA